MDLVKPLVIIKQESYILLLPLFNNSVFRMQYFVFRIKKITVFFLILYTVYGILNTKVNAQSFINYFPSSNISVNAYIGEYHFTLFGYTSPKALVSIEGASISDQTYADDVGYFEFHNRFSPQNPHEICLISQDQLGRISTPVCIPPFPTTYDAQIGPVLLPPTISLNIPNQNNPNNNNYYMGDEIIVSGQTIPNTNVSFSVFTDEKSAKGLLANIYGWNILGFAKPVEAFFFPQLSTKSDNYGNYSMMLPSSNPSYLRLFAQTNFKDSDSPKSNGLNLQIYPVWMMIIQTLISLLLILKNHILEFIILLEIIFLIMFIIKQYWHPHVIAKNRTLALRKLYPIVEEETNIIKFEDRELKIENRI
jgi:hypothetical protein